MSKNELVSIVIPLYNYEKYIEECIKSCLNQTYHNTEIIVVDDCSTDGSVKIVERYLEWKENFRLIRLEKNKGTAHAKNVGIKEAKGDIIVFLDADDMLTHDSIEVRMKYMNPGIDMIHAKAYRYKNGLIDGVNLKSKIHDQTVMIRKRVFEKHGYFYEGLWSKHNKEMWYRLGIHPLSPVREKIKDRKIDKIVAYYRKHSKQKHKLRRKNPKVKSKIEKIFFDRVKWMVKNEGIS